MDQATHYRLVFETAGGFCGIAWNSVGITRFQARQLKNACSRWRAFASILRHRLSNLSSFEMGKRLSEETECREGRRA